MDRNVITQNPIKNCIKVTRQYVCFLCDGSDDRCTRQTEFMKKKKKQNAKSTWGHISVCMHFSHTGAGEGIQSQTGCVFAIPLHHTYCSAYFWILILRGNVDKDKHTAYITRETIPHWRQTSGEKPRGLHDHYMRTTQIKSNERKYPNKWRTNASRQCSRAIVLSKTMWRAEDIWRSPAESAFTV